MSEEKLVYKIKEQKQLLNHVSQIKISELPNDDNVWCLTWTGRILPNSYNRRDTFVDIVLSPIPQSIWKDDKQQLYSYLKNDLNFNELDYKNYIITKISIDYFPFLTWGMLFYKQSPMLIKEPFEKQLGKYIPSHHQLHLKRLNFVLDLDENKRNQKVISANSTKDGEFHSDNQKNIFYIPKINFPLWASLSHDDFYRLRHTSLLRVQLRKTSTKQYQYLLIPCTEVLRYFYLRSSRITRDIFRNSFLDNMESYVKEFHKAPTEAKYHLTLTTKACDKLSPFFTKMCFAPLYTKRLDQMTINMNRQYKKNRFAFPKTYLPEQGKVSLKVWGVPLVFGDETNFLVYKIISCSEDIEYSDIVLERTNDNRKAEHGNNLLIHGWKVNHLRTDENGEDVISASSNLVSASNSTNVNIIADPPPTKLKWIKPPKKQQKYENKSVTTYGPNTTAATGKPETKQNPEKEPREINVSPGDKTQKPFNFEETIEETCKILEDAYYNIYSEKIRWRTFTKNKIDNKDISSLYRELFIAEIFYESKYYYLLDLAPKNGEAYSMKLVVAPAGVRSLENHIEKYIKILKDEKKWNIECSHLVTTKAIYHSQNNLPKSISEKIIEIV